MIPTVDTLPATAVGDTAARKSLSILLADDVDEIRRLMAAWLETEGHTVSHASTGREAIRHALAHACDLIVTDILMPDNDGLDVIIALRRSQPQARFLAISGGGQYMTAHDALHLAHALGADGHLFKPFTRKQFMDAMEQAMAKQR
ncbi:MAG TPA: response regulator [Opitutaceae bacterium]